MRHQHLLVLLGLALIGIGVVKQGWWLIGVWLGCDFLIVGIAHYRGAHGVFGKRSDGSLAMWGWVVFLPLLMYTMGVWHLIRLFCRESARNLVTDDLVVGRRLLPREFEGDFSNFVDLTAEFSEPGAIRTFAGYRAFPILDGSAPSAASLGQFIDSLRPGRTFIHCAQGHGRTGLVALAVLLKSGAVGSVDEGIERLRAIRPGISLSAVQQTCIEKLAAEIIGSAKREG